jgi:hypothetical protein
MKKMTTFIRVGTEMQFAKDRLRDIVYFAKNTQPTKDGDWEGYAKDVLRMIVNQAEQAEKALNLINT